MTARLLICKITAILLLCSAAHGAVVTNTGRGMYTTNEYHRFSSVLNSGIIFGDNSTQHTAGVTASITNGLYPSSNPSNFVNATVTNGLASITFTTSLVAGLTNNGFSGTATNAQIWTVNGIVTQMVSLTEAAGGGSSLTWQRWERHFGGLDIVPYAISNNWGMASGKLDDGTYVVNGYGFASYYSNATQLARGLVTFRANPLKEYYSDTNSTVAVSWFAAGKTNEANASWFLRVYGNQENASLQITNSVLIWTNTTAYVASRAAGNPELTVVAMASLFNTNVFPSYTFDFRPTLLATNPANVQAIYIINGGGGM